MRAGERGQRARCRETRASSVPARRPAFAGRAPCAHCAAFQSRAAASVPLRLLGSTASMRTSAIVPIEIRRAFAHARAEDKGFGRRPGPAWRPGFSNRTRMMRPSQAALNASCCAASSACSVCQTLGLHRFGNLLRRRGGRRSGAGAVFERIGLREADCRARARASLRNRASVSPGKPTMKSDDSAISGRASRMRPTSRR